MKTILTSLLVLSGFLASAQTYSINWYKIAGGGGNSTGGNYAVSGTIGQQDAGGALTGGNYSVSGGYWSLIQVLQTPGAPTLYISYAANGGVTVYWQDSSGWILVEGGDLFKPKDTWPLSGAATLINGTNYLNLDRVAVNSSGNKFFRLKHP